jgi:hypothetical protein
MPDPAPIRDPTNLTVRDSLDAVKLDLPLQCALNDFGETEKFSISAICLLVGCPPRADHHNHSLNCDPNQSIAMRLE